MALKTVVKNFAPALSPTAAKKSAMPNSRKARLVFTGMYQTCRRMLPTWLRVKATINGPPARPSRRGCGNPGKAMGSVASTMPKVMPIKKGTKCVSFSSLSELPSAAAALSRSASLPTICRMSPNRSRRPGTADISMSAVAAGYNHAAEGDVAFGEDEVFIAALTDNALELIEPGASTDHCEAIVAMNDRGVRGGMRFPSVAHAGNRDARLYAAGDLFQPYAIQVGIRPRLTVHSGNQPLAKVETLNLVGESPAIGVSRVKRRVVSAKGSNRLAPFAKLNAYHSWAQTILTWPSDLCELSFSDCDNRKEPTRTHGRKTPAAPTG